MFRQIGDRTHDDVLRLLQQLEAVQAAHPGTRYPTAAVDVLTAGWRWLQSYGRRDERGRVDEGNAELPEPWRPTVEQLAAHAAGLPIPPDREDNDDDQAVQ